MKYKKYKTLRIVSFDHSIDLKKEYEYRLNGESSIKTNLTINPNERDHKSLIKYPVFFVITPGMYKMSEEIKKHSDTIRSLSDKLPNIASDQFFYKTLENELLSTNEIEGVRSTRKEVSDAILSAITSDNTSNRFHSLAYIYLGIRKNESIKIENIQEIRNIWDRVTDGEIKKKNMPDGDIFRAEPVYIEDSSTGEKIHWPYSDESKIKEDMIALIEFMNNDSIPFIPKALISHFFFEYVHPFYDGNGRTGRYLACAYLGKKLDYLTGVNLSYSISKEKDKYYKAFEEVEHIKNFGDATRFIEIMMEIIIKGQDAIIKSLTESINRIGKWFKLIDKSDFDEPEKAVLKLQIQPYLFGAKKRSTLTDNTIIEILSTYGFNNRKMYKSSTKKIIDSLENNGWTSLVKERPKVHIVTDKTIHRLSHEN